MCVFSDKCGACRRKVSQGILCNACNSWFHWDCANCTTRNEDVNWKCNLCVQLEIVKQHEETISNLHQDLEFARAELAALRCERQCKSRSKSPEFQVVSNRRRKWGSTGSLAAKKVGIELGNRFSVLRSPELDDVAISIPISEPTIPKKKKKVLVLGSSHGRGIGPRLQASLGNEYEVSSIFKPNASLSNVVNDLTALSKDHNKDDHVVIVGGPGNSLDRNFNYSIEEDMNNIARRSGHTNVEFVNLFRRHDRPWMNNHVMNVNLWLDLAQLGSDMSHINIIDSSYIPREEYTAHGLHLNARGKDSLVRLIADSIRCHGKCNNKIPTVVSHNAIPFLG